jgi:hypothetical protein
VPTANDSVLIATFPNQTYSVFVDVRVLPPPFPSLREATPKLVIGYCLISSQPGFVSTSSPIGRDDWLIVIILQIREQALQTGQELRVASLTVGSNYSLADCCDKNTTKARCYAALVLRGGIRARRPPSISCVVEKLLLSADIANGVCLMMTMMAAVSLTVEQELVVESYGVVRFTSPVVGAEAALNGSVWYRTPLATPALHGCSCWSHAVRVSHMLSFVVCGVRVAACRAVRCGAV